MEEAKTIEIEYIEHESHLSFHNMSTLLVANEHASWMKIEIKAVFGIPVPYCCLVSVYLVVSCL